MKTHRRANVCTLSVTVIKGQPERHPLFCRRTSLTSSLRLCLGGLQRSDHAAFYKGSTLKRLPATGQSEWSWVGLVTLRVGLIEAG